jgi:hypothetical protein
MSIRWDTDSIFSWELRPKKLQFDRLLLIVLFGWGDRWLCSWNIFADLLEVKGMVIGRFMMYQREIGKVEEIRNQGRIYNGTGMVVFLLMFLVICLLWNFVSKCKVPETKTFFINLIIYYFEIYFVVIFNI